MRKATCLDKGDGGEFANEIHSSCDQGSVSFFRLIYNDDGCTWTVDLRRFLRCHGNRAYSLFALTRIKGKGDGEKETAN